MPKKKPTFKEKVEQFKTQTRSSGFSSRDGFSELADLLYSEIEQIKKSAKAEKLAAKKAAEKAAEKAAKKEAKKEANK